MADAKTLDRIQKLLRLATANSNEEEARSAALACCRLIVSSGAVVQAKSAQSEWADVVFKTTQEPANQSPTREQYEAWYKQRAAQAKQAPSWRPSAPYVGGDFTEWLRSQRG